MFLSSPLPPCVRVSLPLSFLPSLSPPPSLTTLSTLVSSNKDKVEERELYNPTMFIIILTSTLQLLKFLDKVR